MPVNTSHGKAYSIDELIKLGSIGNFGQYNGAVMGALLEIKHLRAKNEELIKENEGLKQTISENMHSRFISEIRKDQSVGKKDK